MKIIAISGSLRRESFNTALLRVAAAQAPADVDVTVWPLDDVPLFNADDEAANGFPPAVENLRREVGAADGLIIASPEYNYSVTGALKNAIDWLSRGADSPLNFKLTAILGGGGRSGTRRAQAHLRDMLQHNSVAVLTEPEVYVAGVRHAFDADGNLTDPSVAADIRKLVAALVDRIRSSA